MKQYKLVTMIQDEKGMVWAERVQVLDVAVNEKNQAVIMHPNEDTCYETLNEAEDKINNWDKV